MQLVSSSAQQQWVALPVRIAEGAIDLAASDVVTADFKGFGGCFNELGWRALSRLDQSERQRVLNLLFSVDDGCGFNYCRLPMGGNDYSDSWYSYAEEEDDFGLEKFSVERDRRFLIPYLSAARAARGRDFYLFASPWSPPAWMKFPKAHNYGTLVWEPKYRATYADYFVRYLKAYQALGIPINAVHVQNEPNSDQKFPSCLWTGAQMRDFIADDLGPAFERAGLSTEIWAGTIERPSFNDWAGLILADPRARHHVHGFGYQWAGKGGIQRLRQSYPDIPFIQTENECGDGENSWDYAHYVFDLIQHYLSNGAEAYVYWNMVLEAGGRSTWGWKQNSMFSVDAASGKVIENPEYFVMRHFAGFVRPGAKVLKPVGEWAGNSLAFRNPDGAEIWVIQNPHGKPRCVNVVANGRVVNAELPPGSVSSLIAPAN